MAIPRVLLADDHQMFLEALRPLLEGAGLEVVGLATSGEEAVRLSRNVAPDVVVLDEDLNDLGGLEVARILLRERSDLRVVLLSQEGEDGQALEALRAGVGGYVLKSQAWSDLLHAIRDVHGGAIYLSPRLSRERIAAASETWQDPLTSREREVLRMVAEGLTTRQIAEALGISFKTAETHRTNVMRKLDIHETAGLVRYAIRRGLIRA